MLKERIKSELVKALKGGAKEEAIEKIAKNYKYFVDIFEKLPRTHFAR